jgi:deoxyadenosine/deoxycytidine kinase
MILAIEGNIGAGKTTLSYEFKKQQWNVLEEPIDLWNVKGTNMLDAYYANPKEMAYLFQQVTLTTKTKQLQKLDTTDWCLDRSLRADMLFAKVQYDNGYFGDLEFGVYEEFYRLCESVVAPVDYYIYLKTPVDICLQRIQQRNRASEQGITKDYLLQLEAEHDAWLLNKENVLVLDGSKSIYDTKHRRQLLEEIDSFLSATAKDFKRLL